MSGGDPDGSAEPTTAEVEGVVFFTGFGFGATFACLAKEDFEIDAGERGMADKTKTENVRRAEHGRLGRVPAWLFQGECGGCRGWKREGLGT